MRGAPVCGRDVGGMTYMATDTLAHPRLGRTDGYAPIQESAIIGRGRGRARVGNDGSLALMCLASRDSRRVFGIHSYLARGRSFALASAFPSDVGRAHIADPNVVRSESATDQGTLRGWGHDLHRPPRCTPAVSQPLPPFAPPVAQRASRREQVTRTYRRAGCTGLAASHVPVDVSQPAACMRLGSAQTFSRWRGCDSVLAARGIAPVHPQGAGVRPHQRWGLVTDPTDVIGPTVSVARFR